MNIRRPSQTSPKNALRIPTRYVTETRGAHPKTCCGFPLKPPQGVPKQVAVFCDSLWYFFRTCRHCRWHYGANPTIPADNWGQWFPVTRLSWAAGRLALQHASLGAVHILKKWPRLQKILALLYFRLPLITRRSFAQGGESTDNRYPLRQPSATLPMPFCTSPGIFFVRLLTGPRLLACRCAERRADGEPGGH